MRRALAATLALLALGPVLGTGADPAPGPAAGAFQFTEVTAEAGLDFVHATTEYHVSAQWMQWISGGVAVGDVDDDGWEDVYFPQAWELALEYLRPPHTFALSALEPQDKLYRARGDGTFVDVTVAAGLGDDWSSNAAVFGDADGDGDLDLAVSGYGLLRLYRNDGTGAFDDVSTASGIVSEGKCNKPCFSTSLAWADPDHDGDLDLYVGNYVDLDLGPVNALTFSPLLPFQPNLYFRNRGDGTFEEVARTLGLHDPDGHALGVTWTDIDDDGWEDLFVANDFSPNSLYRNNGDGTFTDVSDTAGINLAESSMGIAAGDFDFDGDDDLLTTQYAGIETEVFVNDGDGTFTYHPGADFGLGSSKPYVGWGTAFFDPDLDGDLDVFIVNGDIGEGALSNHPNQLYEWRSGQWHDVTDQAGDFAGNRSSRGAANWDFDRDGDEDVLVTNTGRAPPNLLRNDLPRAGASLQLELRQPSGNTFALGAKVRVQPLAEGLPALTKEVRAGASYETGDSRVLTWGLGPATAAEVTVTWPGGAQERHTLAGDHHWRLVRGAPPLLVR